MQWEYSILTQQPWAELDELQADLGQAGADDWELVSAVYHPQRALMLFVFKRPVAVGAPRTLLADAEPLT
jgi:hypothetical protein